MSLAPGEPPPSRLRTSRVFVLMMPSTFHSTVSLLAGRPYRSYTQEVMEYMMSHHSSLMTWRGDSRRFRSFAMYSMALCLLAVFNVDRDSRMMFDVIPKETDGLPAKEWYNQTKAKSRDRASSSRPHGDPSNATLSLRKGSRSTNVGHDKSHIKNETNTIISMIPVVVWPYIEINISSAESRHLEENGIAESPYLEMSNSLMNFDPNVVWIGDLSGRSCKDFYEKVREAKDKRERDGLTTQWPIIILNYGDHSTTRTCHQVEEEMGPGLVKYAQRSIVQERKWNNETGWVESGHLFESSALARYRHTPYFVRTDIIETLDILLKQLHNMTLASPIHRLERRVDVAHFWPAKDLVGVVDAHSNLRTKVNKLIEDIGIEANLTIFVGLAGDAAKRGRNSVDSSYVKAMLKTKIVVVTQRDMWEDHYRLMEAMVTGAMVMTDKMLSLPNGLENGTSIVEFDSAENLRSQIFYYMSHPEE